MLEVTAIAIDAVKHDGVKIEHQRVGVEISELCHKDIPQVQETHLQIIV